MPDNCFQGRQSTGMVKEENALTRVCVDTVVLVVLWIPVLVLYLAGKPFRRGFYCNDHSIMYPFKESTVTDVALYLIFTCIPSIFILYFAVRTRVGDDSNEDTRTSYVLLGRPVPRLLDSIYRQIGVFVFGAVALVLFTDVVKYTMGRLRPHFMVVCEPSVNCSDATNWNVYIEQYTCTGTDEYYLRDCRLSFPSGHAAYSAYGVTYTIMDMQAHIPTNGCVLFRASLQLLLILLAAFTGISRITDYKHHWSDVLAGFLLGFLTAVAVKCYVGSSRSVQNEVKYSTDDKAAEETASLTSGAEQEASSEE